MVLVCLLYISLNLIGLENLVDQSGWRKCKVKKQAPSIKTAVSSWTNQKDLIVAKLGWNGKFRNILSDYFYYLHFLHQFVCSFFIWYEIAKLACFCKKDFPSVIESLFPFQSLDFWPTETLILLLNFSVQVCKVLWDFFLSFFYLHFSSAQFYSSVHALK